jgi:apolipoprotein N-acyltransferase
VSTASAASPFDPYAPRPTLMERHGGRIAAAAVFVLTVLLAVVSFPPVKAPEFAYAMLVPGIFWAYTGPRLKVFAWTILGAQAVAWTILLGWLHHVTWAGLLLLGPFVGVWVGVWYLGAWWVLPRVVGRPVLTRLLAMLGLAGAWVVIEWTRTWLLGGFPWLPLAASQWERPTILQISTYTGAHGVSFVLVMMNLGFAAYAHRLFREGATGLGKRSQEFFLALFLLLACVSVHITEAFNRRGYAQPLARIALVQPAIPQEVKWDPARAAGILDVLREVTFEAATTRPDLIVWPEAVTPLAVRGDAAMQGFVEGLSKQAKIPLLLGSIAVEQRGQPGEAWRNGAFVVTPGEGLAEQGYAKRRLVPFGEFVPLRPVLGWLEKFVPIGGDFEPGEFSSPLAVTLRGQPVSLGPLVCYEDVFPGLAAASVRAGAGALVVVTNNGWFGQGGAACQHAAHAVLRAVETRRPVLRCGNAGWSGWIDEFGHVRATVTDDRGSIYFRGTRTLEVTRDARWIDRLTFYAEHGDWFVIVAAALAFFSVAALKLRE